jgi:cell filamentation protein
MYQAEPDPYCYPGTTVLMNLRGLRDPARLEEFEAEMVIARFGQPLPVGRLTYSHYCAIHRHLFQDVYAWAGKIRTVQISKGGSTFCYPENIGREMERLFKTLANDNHLKGLDAATFASKAAHVLSELNAVHPFREGNGRTQLAFLVALASQAGHPLAEDRFDPEEMLKATIISFGGSEKPLAAAIIRPITQE